MPLDKKKCEYIRQTSYERRQRMRAQWQENLRWTSPYKLANLFFKDPTATFTNKHIIDPTHLSAKDTLRAGLLEGNTSASRPWFDVGTGNRSVDLEPQNHKWLDTLTKKCLSILANSNFYWAAIHFYDDFIDVENACFLIEELTVPEKKLHFQVLPPGTYSVLNNNQGAPVTLIREFTLTVKALVDEYSIVNKNGSADHSMFPLEIRTAYERGNYDVQYGVINIITENEDYDSTQPMLMLNKPWISKSYLTGQDNIGSSRYGLLESSGYGSEDFSATGDKFLRIEAYRRKPFILAKSFSFLSFEYGRLGPTTLSLPLIRSLNKKSLSKDVALDKMIDPPTQGPASIKKSYLTTAAKGYIPVDQRSASAGEGVRPVFEINPQIYELTNSVMDERNLVNSLYFKNYLLHLINNPKTRTATETDAVVQEQRLAIGPYLQSLTWGANTPIVEYVIDYAIHEDADIEDPPSGLITRSLRPRYISLFAQSQMSADIPLMNDFLEILKFIADMMPGVRDYFDPAGLANFFNDRYFLPHGIKRSDAQVEAIQQQRAAKEEQQLKIQQAIEAEKAQGPAAAPTTDPEQENLGLQDVLSGLENEEPF